MDRRQFYKLSTGLLPACVAFFYDESLARTEGRFVDFFRRKEDEMICIDLGRKVGGTYCVLDTARAYLSDGDGQLQWRHVNELCMSEYS